MDNFEKGSLVRQQSTQEVYNTTSFIRQVYAKDLLAENFSSSIPVPEFRVVDVGLLLDAITADPFAAADWKATFTTVIATPGATINGVFQSNGDFSTEVSNWSAVGIADDGEEETPTTILASANFRPTDGAILNGIEISNSFITYDFDSLQWTYKYEEDPTATGSDPKYLHDFRLTVDSTQILGYVVINANDSISANNFITDSAGG